MRVDKPDNNNDNLITIAYEAHQRVIELILLFQDRLDKTKDVILDQQTRNFDSHFKQLKELEDISRKILETATNNKATAESLTILTNKISGLEKLFKDSSDGKNYSDIMSFLKELNHVLDDLSGRTRKAEQIIQKITYALLGISIFVNLLGILIGVGIVPMPWAP